MHDLEKITALVSQLNEYTKAYDEGRPTISDKEWDDLYFALQKLEYKTGIYLPNSPTQRVIYEVKNGLTKIKLTHPMKSLNKTKSIEAIKVFCGNKRIICMGKMDGLSSTLRYEDGKLVSAGTRGDGVEGEDILHNALVIKNIPNRINHKGTLEVDGEVICTYEDFKQFEKDYKNPRNFAAGSLRLLDSSQAAARNLTFIAWDWINNPYETLGEGLNELSNLGFTTVPRWSGAEFDLDNLEEIINIVKASCKGYPIDGLVFKYDFVDEYLAAGETDHHFSGGLAYKFYDEEVETTLRYINYDIGRTGTLTPVAVFAPVEIEGTEVTRASLSNMSVLAETFGSLEPDSTGAILYVTKRNCIIPKIERVEYSNRNEGEVHTPCTYPKHCPICGKPTEIIESDGGVMKLMCTNPQCEGKLAVHIEHYCDMTKGMKIRGLSRTTIEKLIDWGWLNSITDLYTLNTHRDEWIKKPGFGNKSVDNILAAIENSKICDLWQLISAIGCPLIGSNASKQLADEFRTWANFYNSIQENYIYSTLPNFGYEMDKSIHNFNKWEELNNIVNNYNIKINEPKEQTNNLKGITVVITGSLKKYKNRNLLKDDIEAAGGKVAGSVSSNTNYLINNDVTSSSSKNVTAKKLGVEIISEEDFIQKFLT